MKLCVVLVVAGIGCQASVSTSSSTGSGPSLSAAGSAAGNASGSTTAAASSSGGSSAASGTGTSGGSSSGTSAGSSTGRPPPVYVDGGYVRCDVSVLTDAGQETLAWECRPGTYFCATDGTETCAQCLSNSDCTNYDLPTFDPRRPYCDLSSGFVGYQGFCQQCLTSDNCAGTPATPSCDLNPNDWGPPIETIGFETCARTPLGCPPGSSPALGGCAINHCSGDADCVNALTSSQQLAPYCVQGSCAATPNGNACPDCNCYYGNSVCGSPGATALVCNFGSCICADSSQCGAAWPVCQLWPGGEDGGTCGCSSDMECGDAGLRCLTFPPSSFNYGGSACSVPCSDPRFPACSLWSIQAPICDPGGGVCQPCGSDNDCQTKARGPSDGPYCRYDGACGCAQNSDCPQGQTCQNIDVRSQAGGLLGLCALPPAACTASSCSSSAHCDIDGGACIGGCLSDDDCWNNSNGRICDADSGACGWWCSSDPDCVKFGFAAGGDSYCDLATLTCTYGCESDADCTGNVQGPHCLSPGVNSRCGCGHDIDCVGNPNGSYCDVNPDDAALGYCVCLDDLDCPAGELCPAGPGQTGVCESNCYYSDGGCPPNFFCDPSYNCRPRCDPGHSCQAPASVCDVDDVVGQNMDGGGVDGGAGDGGAEDVVWCYQCLTANDCPDNQACNHYSFTCGGCYESQDCHPGEVCLDGDCNALCDGGACPAAMTCDTDDVALNGPDICYQCLSPSDCPAGLGCNARTHTCGTCNGPNVENLRGGCQPPYESCGDCPPDAICSNYWVQNFESSYVPSGVCLQNCDFVPCPAGTTCTVLPDFTLDHAYCIGCLTDADCADTGPGAWCDTSLNLTFTCQPAAK